MSFRTTCPFFHARAYLVFAVLLCACLSGQALAVSDLALMERLAARYGASTVNAVSAWRAMMVDAQALSEREQIERVNRYLNRRVRFEDDIVVWHQQDYWATPLELFSKGAGDCEDFAIAKYATLRLLGIPAERLRLVYARARIGAPGSDISQAHMVLAYYAAPNADPLILDNLIEDLRPASRRPDLFPVFSFNNEGLWVPGATTSSADPTTRLSRWRDVLERMRREGLDLS
jgi:predicted transglutaminase-like cysteine proteinase